MSFAQITCYIYGTICSNRMHENVAVMYMWYSSKFSFMCKGLKVKTVYAMEGQQ